MKKGFKSILLLMLAVMLLVPSYVQATESVSEEYEIDFNTSENSLKIQSYKKGQQELKEQISTDTLVVKYNKRLPNSVHQRAGMTVVKSIPSLGYDVVKLNKGQKIQTAIRYYANTNDVVSVQPSMKYKKLGGQGDPKKNNMYHLSLLNIDQALEHAGNHPVTVAVIDTGIDQNHPELKSQILPPYNAANPAAGQALDIHGTHVAGIIGAAMNNGIGGHGVSPNAKILPIDVFNGEWGASDYVLAEAIMYAIEKDADVINMSLGGYFESSIFKEAVQQAIDAGITVVAAAGNEETDEYSIPASYDGVISVGAIDRNKNLAYFSNYGPSVNLVAPGVDVYSAIFNPLKGSSFMEASGTSMASPVVAGVVALIKSKYPDLLPHEIQALLEHTATDLGEKGYDHTFGHGLVNPVAALTYDLEKLPQRAEQIPENQMLKKAEVLPDTGKHEATGTFTKPGEVHYYQTPIKKGEKLQTILSGSQLYDYQYEITYFPKRGKSHEPILINDAKAGGIEGYLFEAEADGTLLIKVRDANGNYSLNGRSEYTFTAEKLSELILDDLSTDNMIPIKLPYQSSLDNEGPFTLLSEEQDVADYDYFTFSVQEEQLVSIHLAALPGVDTSLAVYDAESFNQEIDFEEEIDFGVGGDWIALASKNGIGGAERLFFEALPGIEYVLEVAGEPQFGDFDIWDFLLGFFDDEEAEIGRSSLPYELTIEKVILPPDEDGLPNDDFLGDFDEDWFYEEEEEGEDSKEEEEEERMFEEFEVDKLLEHAVPFKVGAKRQGYFQFEEDEDYYQFEPNEDAIYEVNVEQGENQSPYVTVYEYDEATHDLLPVLDLYSFFDEKAALKGAVALQANKTYVLQILNFEGISIDPYTFLVKRIKDVPVAKSDNKSKPKFAQEMKRGEVYEDYFIYGHEQYYYYKNEDASQIFTVHALPKKLTNEKQSQLPAALNNELVVGMAIIEDTNGNKKIDEDEYNKFLQFYPNTLDPSFAVNGSFKAKQDVGYFIVLVNFSEGLSLQQLSLQLHDTNRVDEDHDSIVKNNIPSKPLSLEVEKDQLVGKGYFNTGIPFGDKDYYIFQVENKGKATLTLKAGPGLDGIMKVYNEKGVLVGNFDYYGAGDDEIGTLTVSEGKYYVEVSEAVNTPSVTPYDLSISIKPDPSFIDVNKNNSHYEGIMYWTQKGVINGYTKENGSKEFKPGLTISRAHTAVLFTRALNLPVPKDVPTVLNNFTDVNANHVYANEIAATYQSNIFVGNNKLFNGNDSLTREQMATILVRAYGLVDNGKKVAVDLSNVSPSHRENVKILIQHDITTETVDFRPKDYVTRGQFSTFLYRTEQAKKK
ncbi:S8 family peptidase [Sporosarcina ureilytica]|uniref:SLH domain-containing protein n=1 Tax=Sporosarcina ureilytica TaxID=298596 RepID=A0A1D8JJA6_9BACL|nr:S8 family serine peptidase [Sporosarcina ureilytica]AOV08770.1 hypothetical protein BI350_15275 [Sporosarcina ureilytica]